MDLYNCIILRPDPKYLQGFVEAAGAVTLKIDGDIGESQIAELLEDVVTDIRFKKAGHLPGRDFDPGDIPVTADAVLAESPIV